MITTKYIDHLVLRLKPANSKEICADFNRLRYDACPSTEKIRCSNAVEHAQRDEIIISMKPYFVQSDKSHSTLETLFKCVIAHFKFSDKNKLAVLSKRAITHQLTYELNRYQRGEIKSSLYLALLSNFSSVLTLLELESQWLREIPRVYRDDTESYESYSREELKIILPPLRSMFSQFSTQFLSDPEKHMEAHKNTASMAFVWKGKTYSICGGISKMMASAAFLLSYYTWSNTSVIFQLKRPKKVSYDLSKTWYVMPAFKRRAFKTISVEISADHTLEIPKYSFEFFNKLLTISQKLDSSPNALLFQKVIANKKSQLSSATLTSFNQFTRKTLWLRNINGEVIPYQISRFRETGAQTFMVNNDSHAASLLLDNQPNTIKKHYSKGNTVENRSMLQDSTSILETQSRNKSTVKDAIAIRKLDIKSDTLTLEKKLSDISRTANGTYCNDTLGAKAKTFTKRAESHKLLHEGEKLACADLLKCFSCKHQVIIESEYDIWCLLSFKECIEESIPAHLNAQHYANNFESILVAIRKIIIKVSNKTLRKAEQRLQLQGRHPLWQDLFLLPTSGDLK